MLIRPVPVPTGDDVAIADLVAAPGRQQAALKTLAHVEFQLRVLGLLCAAAAGKPSSLTTPGSLDVWSRYITLHRGSLNCDNCESAALDVADSINTEVATGTSVRQMRNQVFHGGPDPENVDLDALHGVVSANAAHIVAIHAHRHVTQLEPFFIHINSELAALHDYSEGSATYWPRRGVATDTTRPETVEALQKLGLQGGDRLLESFALDIQKDLRGFAERDSIQTLVAPPQPIVVRWDLRTSGGTIPRIDRFELNASHSPSGDRCGSCSTAGVLVNRRASPPLRSTIHRSPPCANAMCWALTVGWRSSLVSSGTVCTVSESCAAAHIGVAIVDMIRMARHHRSGAVHGVRRAVGRTGGQSRYSIVNFRVQAAPGL
jgi:hypothetical protein